MNDITKYVTFKNRVEASRGRQKGEVLGGGRNRTHDLILKCSPVNPLVTADGDVFSFWDSSYTSSSICGHGPSILATKICSNRSRAWSHCKKFFCWWMKRRSSPGSITSSVVFAASQVWVLSTFLYNHLFAHKFLFGLGICLRRITEIIK